MQQAFNLYNNYSPVEKHTANEDSLVCQSKQGEARALAFCCCYPLTGVIPLDYIISVNPRYCGICKKKKNKSGFSKIWDPCTRR